MPAYGMAPSNLADNKTRLTHLLLLTRSVNTNIPEFCKMKDRVYKLTACEKRNRFNATTTIRIIQD